jgi:hypothetical protein
MKKLLVLLLLVKSTLLRTQIPVSYQVPSGVVNSGNILINGNNLGIGNGGYMATTAGQLQVTASHEIYCQPGLYAGTFSSGGYADFKIDANQVAIASFHQNGFTGIPKYERFELGIKLPQYIQDQINAFLITKTNGPNKINPYDPNQIRISCQFTSPNNTYNRNGFYYVDYTTIPVDKKCDKWVMVLNDYTFRIRFAPPDVGTYTGIVSLVLNNSTTINSYQFSFTVVQNTNKGHLSVLTANTNILKLGYNDGSVFFGIGRAVPFALWSTNNSDNSNGPNPNGLYTTGTDWREIPSNPNTHRDQRTIIRDLAKNGGNFVRIRLDEWSVPIETLDPAEPDLVTQFNNAGKYLNNYHHNQMFMWEMDSTLAACESKNMHIMLNLVGDWWFPDPVNVTTNYAPLGWHRTPYTSLLGNSIASRDTFFTDPTAIAIFKRRLYYIEARWGYSPSIGLWEMINETENMDCYPPPGSNPTFPNNNPANHSNISSWICEMANYLKTGFYPSHPVTNGTVKFYDYPYPYVNNHTNASCLDVFSSNSYIDAWDATHQVPASIWNLQYDFGGMGHMRYWDPYYTGKKPFIWGELGHSVDKIDVWSDSHFHTTVWESIFENGIGTGMYWHSWCAPNSNLPHPRHVQYNAVKKFVSRINFNQILLPDLNETPAPWRLSSYGSPGPYFVNEGLSDPVITYWMRTTDRKTVYGWSRNTHANWTIDAYPQLTGDIKRNADCRYGPNANNCGCVYDSIGNPVLDPQQNCFPPTTPPSIIANSQITLGNNSILVQGLLQSKSYKIELFDTWDPSGALLDVQFVQTDIYGALRFGRTMPTIKNTVGGQNYYPDYAFIARACAVEGPEGCIAYSGDGEPQGRMAGDLDNTSTDNKVNINSDMSIDRNDNIYPVPASNKVYLSLATGKWSNPSAFVIDAMGRVFEKKINADGSISIDEFSNGFYTLKVKDDNHEKLFKFIIQR